MFKAASHHPQLNLTEAVLCEVNINEIVMTTKLLLMLTVDDDKQPKLNK